MKKYIFYLTLLILTTSCKGQNNDIIKIDSSRVKEIIIKNKVSYSQQELIDGKIVITNRDKIESILNSLNHSKKILEPPSLNANFGYFDIEIIEGDKSHFYGINYTVYDGVIIADYNSTKRYKNDELEGLVYSIFIK